MKDYDLKHIDPEDIEYLLVKVETSFDIKFIADELFHITTFGQLCDHIANKIVLDNSNDCTSQQAFYKLRDAISSTLQVDKKIISPNFPLTDLLPRQNRRSMIKKLEKYVGFKLNILGLPQWVTNILIILLLASIVGLFFNWQIGLSGLVLSIAGLRLENKLGNEFELQTVGQVAEKMTREHYLKSRRNPKTFNKQEVEKVVTEWFNKELHIDKSKLTKEAKFV